MTGVGEQRKIPRQRMTSPDRLPWRWENDAACQDYPAQWWDPAEDTPLTRDNERAIVICGMCAVQAECERFGRGEAYGIWAGQVHTARHGVSRRVPADPVRAALASLPPHVTHAMVLDELGARGWSTTRRRLERFRSGATTRLELSEADAILAVIELLRWTPAPVTQADAYRSGKQRKGSSGWVRSDHRD